MSKLAPSAGAATAAVMGISMKVSVRPQAPILILRLALELRKELVGLKTASSAMFMSSSSRGFEPFFFRMRA